MKEVESVALTCELVRGHGLQFVESDNVRQDISHRWDAEGAGTRRTWMSNDAGAERTVCN